MPPKSAPQGSRPAAALNSDERLSRILRRLFDGACIGILFLDSLGNAVEANPALEAMLGVGPGELTGARFSGHLIGEDRDIAEELLAEMMGGGRESFALQARCATRRRDTLWVHVRAVLERDETGAPAFAVAMIENITERKQAEQELIRQSELNQHHALHDPLTGLPNRVLFGDRISQAVREARRSNTLLAVALMDLDRFKEVNDSLGHAAGDQLLVEVSRRMRDAVRASDTVARLGGDEFGLLLPRLSRREDAVTVLDRIRGAFEWPIFVHSRPLAVDASVGIAVFPGHGSTAEALIQCADVAMYDSKRDRAPFRFFDPGAPESDHGRLTRASQLQR